MRVLILGSEGYIGRALKTFLKEKGHIVSGVDNGLRESMVKSIGSKSLVPVFWNGSTVMDIEEYPALCDLIRTFKPQAIVHLAEIASAPYSMKDVGTVVHTQHNNVCGTLKVLWAIKEINPKIHLIKLGTAGEYPDWLYKNITVPEGARIKVKYQGKNWEIPTPRYAGSFYHFSKLFDSFNIDYACRIWGLNVTDINQGVVYGHRDGTRLDYDEYFGTVVNRFCVQAIAGMPLTVYGTGDQMRSFINLQNSIEAIELIMLNPAKGYRIIHQLTETHTINQIADMVWKYTNCKIKRIKNPRAEMAKNKFKFEAKKLRTLGLKTKPMFNEIGFLLAKIYKYRRYIRKGVIEPKILWKQVASDSRFVNNVKKNFINEEQDQSIALGHALDIQ